MRTDRLSVKILALLLSLLTLLPLASCGVTAPDETEEITAAPTTTEEATTAVSTAEAEEPAKYTVVLNAPASTAIHTPVQASFLSDDDPLSVKDYLRPAYTAQSVNYDDKPGTIELGRPVPITLTWSVETEQTESDIRVFSIRVWPKSAPRKAVTKNLTKSVTSFTLENPMIGTTYCWTVTATDGEGNSYASDVGTFTTDAQGPRNLTVGGLTNVRDLGGWATEDGGRVRQGLLFRGSKLACHVFEFVAVHLVQPRRRSLEVHLGFAFFFLITCFGLFFLVRDSLKGFFSVVKLCGNISQTLVQILSVQRVFFDQLEVFLHF